MRPRPSGLKQTLGFGAPTCSLKDWIGTELIILIGTNLANNQPVSTKYLHYAKKAGARIVVVNPFREPALDRYWVPSVLGSALFGTKLMDDFYPVRPGGDIAFLSGVLKALDEIGGWDEKFVAERTEGAAELRAHLRQARLEPRSSPSRASAKPRFASFADHYAQAPSARSSSTRWASPSTRSASRT